MRIAVISDIHANLEALDAVMEDIRGQDLEDIWCLGDIVGYGADPNPVTERITAEVEIPDTDAKGVILAQGGRFGGWSLYLKDGKPAFTYNFLGLQQFTIAAAQPSTAGKATIRFEFAYEGGGMGKGGKGTILVNDNKVAKGRIERTQCCVFSADETADVGRDDATPVTEDYKEGDNAFTGTIHRITIELKDIKATDHAEEHKLRAEAAHKKALSD